MSKELVTLHHDKHHAAYVNGANAILQRLDKAKAEEQILTPRPHTRKCRFISAVTCSIIFSGKISPCRQGRRRCANGVSRASFSTGIRLFERFKKLFSQAAASVEGSGWATLTFCKLTNRPIIMQVEKHNVNIYPMFRILMALDVWEHAYYLDYKNDRAKFVEAYWNIVNWGAVSKSLEEVL